MRRGAIACDTHTSASGSHAHSLTWPPTGAQFLSDDARTAKVAALEAIAGLPAHRSARRPHGRTGAVPGLATKLRGEHPVGV